MDPSPSERTTNLDNENHEWERCSLAPSTSTASNLSGPGRALDNLYGSLGRRLDVQLGRLAEKFGRGPRMTAFRIERRRSKALNLPPDTKKVQFKNKKIVKDCKKLVSYVRSNTPSTQVQALEQITRLSIQDSFVRDALLNVGAENTVNQLRASFLGTFTHVLLARSRKTLLSLTETEVNTIGQEIRTEDNWCLHGACSIADYSGSDNLRHLKTFLSDPDRAWLVLRHLYVSLTRLSGHCLSCLRKLFDGIFVVITSLPNNMEWSTLDHMIERFLLWFSNTESHGSYCEREDRSFWGSLLEFILRHAERLPNTVNSGFFSKFSSYGCTVGDVNPRLIYLTFQLLRNLADTNGFEIKTSIGPGHTTVAQVYDHPTVQPLLRRITCPPEVLLSRFVWNRYEYERVYDVNGLCQCVRMLDPVELDQLCSQLSEYLNSKDELIRQRTLHAFSYLMTIDLYSRSAALRFLSQTPFAQSRDFRELVDKTEKKCVPHSDPSFAQRQIFRHCDDNKVLLHLEESRCDMKGGTRELISLPVNYVRELRLPRGSAFSAKGIHAIIAGITPAGEKAYIALPVSESEHAGEYVAITEGTKPEDTCIQVWEVEEGELVRNKVDAAYLAVYTLRYAPEAYSRNLDENAGVDATGPFSWKSFAMEDEDDFTSEHSNEDEDCSMDDSCGEDDGESHRAVEDGTSSGEDWVSANERESVDIAND